MAASDIVVYILIGVFVVGGLVLNFVTSKASKNIEENDKNKK